jgi:hypothetical protein
MREVDELAVEPLARHLSHVHVGMREQKAEQFAAGVSGRAQDRRRDAGRHVPLDRCAVGE